MATVNAAETNRSEIIGLMVGRELKEVFPERTLKTDEKMLEVEHFYGNGDTDISIYVNRGEIVGLAGLLGAGRTELARMIYGADKKISGKILINGEEVNIKSPRDAIRNNIGLVPEDRKKPRCHNHFGNWLECYLYHALKAFRK